MPIKRDHVESRHLGTSHTPSKIERSESRDPVHEPRARKNGAPAAVKAEPVPLAKNRATVTLLRVGTKQKAARLRGLREARPDSGIRIGRAPSGLIALLCWFALLGIAPV